MKKIVTVERLKAGDRFEFITSRSEWTDNCYLAHPKGVIVVAKSAFTDPYQQCRFSWRLETYPNAKPQDWWGTHLTKVRLLGAAPVAAAEVANDPVKRKKNSPK
jgi:hypothetical protein